MVHLFLGYSGGPAAVQQSGFCGAPCESGLTCGGCHRGSSIFGNTSEDFILLDPMTGDTVVQYLPGYTYKAYVRVISPGQAPRYGFQATALGCNNQSTGLWSNPGRDTQISTANVDCETGRVYIEHTVASFVDTFSAYWTAPLDHCEVVTFYFVGNAVNGDGATTGDRGGFGASKSFLPHPDDGLLCLNDSINTHYLGYSIIINKGTVYSLDSAYQSASDHVTFRYPFVVESGGIIEVKINAN